MDVLAGGHTFPSLLAQVVQGNTSFEYPTFNDATTGNLPTKAGFEDRDNSDIYGGTSFKSGGLTEGPTDGGSTMVELDAVREGFHKEATTGIVSGHQYTYNARVKLPSGASNGSKIRLSLEWYNGATLLQTDSIEYGPGNGLVSAIWQTFTVTEMCPDGATRFVCRGELTTKVGQGSLVDNLSALDLSLIIQQGWWHKATGDAKVLAVKWDYEGGFHGA